MKLLNNLKILSKLAIPALMLITVAVGLVALAWSSLNSLDQNTQRIVDVTAARAVTALQMAYAMDEATIREKNIIIETDASAMQAQFKLYQEARQDALNAIDHLIGLADTPERRAVNEAIKADLNAFFSAADKSIGHGLKNENDLAAKVSNSAVRETRAKVSEAVKKRVEANMKDLSGAKAQASEVAGSAVQTLITAAAVGLAIAVGLLAYIVVIGVTRPLAAMTNAMGALAHGDLAVEVHGSERRDEVGLLARSLQVFKDNAVTAQRLAAEQASENEAKLRRAERLDQVTRSFEHNVSALTQGLAGAST
ncbi:HAMP domain-containing protein, partial [Methylobacterium iners]